MLLARLVIFGALVLERSRLKGVGLGQPPHRALPSEAVEQLLQAFTRQKRARPVDAWPAGGLLPASPVGSQALPAWSVIVAADALDFYNDNYSSHILSRINLSCNSRASILHILLLILVPFRKAGVSRGAGN